MDDTKKENIFSERFYQCESKSVSLYVASFAQMAYLGRPISSLRGLNFHCLKY